MHLPGRQDNSSEPQRQPTQDPTIPTTTSFSESDHSSEDDADQDEIYPLSPSTPISLAIRFTTRETMDLYDKLPPELLEHILTLLPHPTLFFCTTLSKRWARMVIPHLWHSPWMMYYVSWMKLLQTISYCSLTTLTSTSPGRGGGGGVLIGASKFTAQRNQPSHSRAPEDDINKNQDDSIQEPALAWDNFSDHEDEDPSGLLRLAENQRRESVMVAGWEIPDRTLSSWSASTTSGGYRCGFGTKGNTHLHESEPNSVASDDTNTKPSFVVSSRPFNVQGKSHLCPYVDMPSSSSLALPLEAVTNSIGISTATSHKHASSKRQKKNTARSSLPSPGLVSSSPSKPFLRPNYGPLIRTLDFSELYYILSDKFLTHLFPHTPQLSTLIVSAPKQFTDESLYVLATCCPALQRCELLGCDQITDRGVHFLLEQQYQQDTKNPSDNGSKGGGSTLRILSLANRASITDGVLQHLAYVTFASKLERLNLANAVFVTGQDPGLGTVFRCCTGLKALNVSHCQGVTDELLGTLRSADTLQSLNVAYCYAVTDRGICKVAKACGQLEELDISACGAVSDTSLYALGRWCRGFRRLVVDEQYGGRVTEQGLGKFPWGVEVLQGWRRYSQRSGRSSRRIF